MEPEGLIQLSDMIDLNRSSVTLHRALGRWDLTAIGINQVIGSAIFLMPSTVAAQIGNWSPLAFVLAGLVSKNKTIIKDNAFIGSNLDAE